MDEETAVAALGACEEGYRAAGATLARLFDMLGLNVTALRKILKKHDKQFLALPLAPVYLRNRTSEENPILRSLFSDTLLDAILAALRIAFAECHQIRRHMLLHMRKPQDVHTAGTADDASPVGATKGAAASVDDLLTSSSPSLEEAPTITAVAAAGGIAQQAQEVHMLGMGDLHEPVLKRIEASRRRLARALERTVEDYFGDYSELALEGAFIRRRAHPEDEGEEDEEAAAEEEEEQEEEAERTLRLAAGAKARPRLKRAEPEKEDILAPTEKPHPVSFWLCLCSTFLYMANYYIVAPTGKDYARDLGQNGSMSGIIIVLVSFGAFFSSIGYSVWTNKSYKQPLVFAAGVACLGNLLYGLALDANSIWVLFTGRILVGLGGARGVVRRYVADVTPAKQRTSASTLFVNASSAGLVAGPLIAIALNFVDFQTGAIHINAVTAPGWVMAALWFIYALLLSAFFIEPEMVKSRSSRLEKFMSTRQLGANSAIDDSLPGASAAIVGSSAGPTIPHAIRIKDTNPALTATAEATQDAPTSAASPASGATESLEDQQLSEAQQVTREHRASRRRPFPRLDSDQDQESKSLPARDAEHTNREANEGSADAAEHGTLQGGSVAAAAATTTTTAATAATTTAAATTATAINNTATATNNGNDGTRGLEGASLPGTADDSPRTPDATRAPDSPRPPNHEIELTISVQRSPSSLGSLRKRATSFHESVPNLRSLFRKDDHSEKRPETVATPWGIARRDSVIMRLLEHKTKSSFLERFTPPARVLIFLLAAQKFSLDSFLSASPLFVETEFGWQEILSSVLLAWFGALAIPGGYLLRHVSKRTSDLNLILGLLALVVCFVLLTIRYQSQNYSESRFLIGSSCYLICIQILEGTSLSLLSKVISPELALGVLNSGMLATAAGNLGRVIGGILIAVIGIFAGESNLLDYILFNILGVCVVSMLLIIAWRSELAPRVFFA